MLRPGPRAPKSRRLLSILTLLAVPAALVMGAQAATFAQSDAPPAASAPVPSGPTIDRVRQAGAIRIGYSNEFPFAFAEGDQVTGEAPEMMKAFAATIGVPAIDGVLIEWAGLIPALQAQRIDAIAAGMAITPERCKQVLFAEPEVVYTGGLIVKAGNPKNITSWKSIADQPDTKLGLIAGTTDAGYPSYNNIAEERVSQFPDFPSLLAAVQGGRVDAAWLDALSAKDLVAKSGDPNLEVVVPALADLPLNDLGKPSIGWGAVVFRPDEADLRDAFTAWLQAAKQSGQMRAIMEPFGFGEDQIAPLGTSVEELCTG